MRILRLFKNHVLALLAVLALLIISCNADLALPTYMSEIVDVGIQQGGIESPVPSTVRSDALADLELFMSEGNVETVEAAYGEANSDGVRSFVGESSEQSEDSELADIMSKPETVVLSLNEGIDASLLSEDDSVAATTDEAAATEGSLSANPALATGQTADPETMELMAAAAQDPKLAEALQALQGGTIDMDTVRVLANAGVIEKGKLVEAADAMAEQMGSMSGSIIEQRAISWVSAEYEAQGIDLTQVQNDYLSRMTWMMFGLCLVSLVATALTGAVASHTASVIARDLRRETFAKVMQMGPAEVGKFSQASLITRCTNDIQQVQMAATMFMRMVLMAPIMACVAVIRVLQTSTGLEWTIGIAIIAVSALVGVLMGLTMPRFRRMQKYVDRVNLVAREMLDGLMPIRAFGQQQHELERFDDASRDLMQTQLFTNRAMSFMMPGMMFVMNCITVLIVWAGSHGVNDGVMQVGSMMAFMSYTMQIVMSFMILTMVSVILPRAEVAAQRVDEVRNCEISIKDPESPQLPAADAPRGQLEFCDVGFRYPDADTDVVEHVSFKLEPGQMLGIIGSTGSGKSTLVQLIPRLYDASAGSVKLDGIDVRNWGLSELRQRIGYIPQQGRLFSGTVESNLKFAGEGVSDADMRKAAEIAQAADFIAEREGGYESEISQGGTNVSGGQRQRLAIARALAKNPEVVVFDDSFSALDYKTDARLRDALSREVKDAALVVVGQRIATIMHADEILVLDDGCVVGQGTHEELLRSCPAYLEIAQSQLSPEELGLTETEVAAVLEGGAC